MIRAKERARRRRNRRLTFASLIAVLIVAAGIGLAHSNVAVLEPAGAVASGEKRLLITAFLLMLIVVIPVFVILFTVAWRYRETNKKATYRPEWDGSRLFETVWWVIPGGLIIALALITWRGTFQYDPYKPVALKRDTMTVQVVAEPGWWLFLYPQQQVASVNQLYLPVNQATRFEITADAPMNSFWIPQLGGQMYAMPGMVSQLNLVAAKTGSYRGSSANISGRHFADMHFQTIVSGRSGFDGWVKQARTASCLDSDSYGDLRRTVAPVGLSNWRLDPQLFDQIVAGYGAHGMVAMAPNQVTMKACFNA